MARPNCFGKSFSTTHVVCTGGTDPTWVEAVTGSRVRPRCPDYQDCGRASGKLADGPRLIPANTLVRPAYTPPTYQQPQPTPSFRPPTATTPGPMMAPQGMPSLPPIPTPQYAPQPQNFQPHPIPGHQHAGVPFYPQQQAPYGYQQMMPVNYGMPGYLTAPEPSQPGFARALGRTVARSIAKAFGHSIAHFFDANTLGDQNRKE